MNHRTSCPAVRVASTCAMLHHFHIASRSSGGSTSFPRPLTNLGLWVSKYYYPLGSAGRPGSSEVPRKPLTRWDVSSIPVNRIFLTKKLENKIKMPNGWRTIKSLVHKVRLHGRRGKGMAESFSREKLRHAPQKEGG